LLQRPGSVIPVANLAQSTDELRTDSLTLLVCLDKELKACGSLYEDEGDGFGYREGNYCFSRIEAVADRKMLTVSVTGKEGKMLPPARVLRIGLVSDGRVVYSQWQEGSEATMRISLSRKRK
jgi:alpha-glucosidase